MPKNTLTSEITVSYISKLVGGSFSSNGERQVLGLCSLEDGITGHLSFSRSRNPATLQSQLENSLLAAVIVSSSAKTDKLKSSVSLISVPDPTLAMLKVVPLFYSAYPVQPGISPRADVHPSATIGANVTISPFSVIGENVVIEDNVHIHPQVTVYPGAKIGAGSILHAGAIIREDCVVGCNAVIQNGAIIGADGFGYVADGGNGLVAIPQVGTVHLEDGVDVGANSCIDRATLGTTLIGNGTKIDNLVQVGHNTVIGEHCIICGHSGVAGSCSIGDQVVIGGGSGVADHISIESGSRLAAKSGVIADLTSKGDYAGFPAVPLSQWRRQGSILRKLAKNFRAIEKILGENDAEEKK